MGRRSIHTPEELRDLIIKSATAIIERDGLSGLSAREIAKRINYSPGTLYNVFENLDDLLLTIEGRLLDQLSDRIADVKPTGTPSEQACQVAEAYLEFVQERPELWRLLLHHRLPASKEWPAWYNEKLQALYDPIADAVSPAFTNESEEERRRAVAALTASLHGMMCLATTAKFAPAAGTVTKELINDLVSTYLLGLAHRGKR